MRRAGWNGGGFGAPPRPDESTSSAPAPSAHPGAPYRRSLGAWGDAGEPKEAWGKGTAEEAEGAELRGANAARSGAAAALQYRVLSCYNA